MYLQRKRPDTPGVLQSCTKQRQNTVTCGARGLKCKTQNDKCTILYTPADPAVAEDANYGVQLRRMNASSDLSEYAAEYRQSVESQCGKDAGAADSPDSAEHIWQAPLPESKGSSNDGTSDESDVNKIDDGLAERFRRAAKAIEERRTFITEYFIRTQKCEVLHTRYYIEGREVTEDYFVKRNRARNIEVVYIGARRFF